MSFPWDSSYAVILLNWAAPGDFQVCAGEPFSEFLQAVGLQQFDSVQLISTIDYELVPQPTAPQTLIYLPDSRRFEGVVHQLKARPSIVEKLMAFALREQTLK